MFPQRNKKVSGRMTQNFINTQPMPAYVLHMCVLFSHKASFSRHSLTVVVLVYFKRSSPFHFHFPSSFPAISISLVPKKRLLLLHHMSEQQTHCLHYSKDSYKDKWHEQLHKIPTSHHIPYPYTGEKMHLSYRIALACAFSKALHPKSNPLPPFETKIHYIHYAHSD